MRTLRVTGKNALRITIPTEYARKVGLQKGQTVYIRLQGKALVLSLSPPGMARKVLTTSRDYLALSIPKSWAERFPWFKRGSEFVPYVIDGELWYIPLEEAPKSGWEGNKAPQPAIELEGAS